MIERPHVLPQRQQGQTDGAPTDAQWRGKEIANAHGAIGHKWADQGDEEARASQSFDAVAVDPSAVIMTTGSKMAMLFLARRRTFAAAVSAARQLAARAVKEELRHCWKRSTQTCR